MPQFRAPSLFMSTITAKYEYHIWSIANDRQFRHQLPLTIYPYTRWRCVPSWGIVNPQRWPCTILGSRENCRYELLWIDINRRYDKLETHIYLKSRQSSYVIYLQDAITRIGLYRIRGQEILASNGGSARASITHYAFTSTFVTLST